MLKEKPHINKNMRLFLCKKKSYRIRLFYND